MPRREDSSGWHGAPTSRRRAQVRCPYRRPTHQLISATLSLPLTKSASQVGESERLAAAGHQGAHFALFAATAVLFKRAYSPDIGHFRRNVAAGCQPEVRMNSKWESFGSSNRIRTHIRLVNSHRLLVDCHVVRSSNVWPLRERAGETAERFSLTPPRARKPAKAGAGRANRRLTQSPISARPDQF